MTFYTLLTELLILNKVTPKRFAQHVKLSYTEQSRLRNSNSQPSDATISHTAVTLTIKLFPLPLHNYNFATDTNGM